MKGKNVIIVHGYTASPADNWFPWLKKELELRGATVAVPAMPEPHSPDPQKWQQCLISNNITADGNTIFVGQSLGCITVLRYIAEHIPEGTKLGGYILVSGFDCSQETLPELEAHVQYPLDYTKLTEISDKRISVISSDDWVVSPQASKTLAESLQTQVIVENNAGHFLDREGYTEFPALLNIFRTVFSVS
ncbi:TPA: RBBP9/YdeN family alpha/beta hydrolase [Morganella morganii]